MFDEWSDDEVLTLVEDAHRDTAMATARPLAAIAELLERRIGEELGVEADVKSMNTRLPAVGALLATGEVGFDTVELVLARTDLVAQDFIGQVDASVAAQLRRWQSWSRAQVIIAIDQAVALVDADAVKQRRIAAYDDRSVTVTTGLDGMAVVRVKISGTEGADLGQRLARPTTPDGTIVWTSPIGRTHVTTPAGADLFPGWSVRGGPTTTNV
jgi:hypothetical protein